MAQTMKLANNLLSATAMAATSEAVVMGVKAGLDPTVMIEVINAGSGLNTREPRQVSRVRSSLAPSTTVSPTASCTRICGCASRKRKALGVSMRVGSMVRDMFKIAVEEHGVDADFTTIVKTVEKPAGVEVRSRGSK